MRRVAFRQNLHCCVLGRFQQELCANFFEAFVGMVPGRIDPTMVSTILSHSPGGASSKLCTHMAQIFRNGEHLSKYDYGPEINLKVKVHTMLDLRIIKLRILFSSERQCSRTDDLIFTGLRDVSSRALQHVECGCSNCAHRRR